jgi:hypothetical protein
MINNRTLTIKQGCFNCYNHTHKRCNLTYPSGTPIDVLKIQINDKTGEKYRTGCCCATYIVDLSYGKETVTFT